MGCHALLQGIFLTQGSNLHLLQFMYSQAGSLPLEPSGKPQWVLQIPANSIIHLQEKCKWFRRTVKATSTPRPCCRPYTHAREGTPAPFPDRRDAQGCSLAQARSQTQHTAPCTIPWVLSLEDKAPASSPHVFARVVPVPGVLPLPLHLATFLLLLHPAQVPAFSGNLP